MKLSLVAAALVTNPILGIAQKASAAFVLLAPSSVAVQAVGIGAVPEDAVLCEGQPEENYCDCGGDCHDTLCACADARECCAGASDPGGDAEGASGPGGAAEEPSFPAGSCHNLDTFANDGESCHALCHQFNLLAESNGTWPDRDVGCHWDETARAVVCEDAQLRRFSECQQQSPDEGPYERTQCVCGGEEVVACDSDYHTDKNDKRPPLECASLNVTDRNSCIDVATNFGKDWYCNESSTPCVLKYQTIGDRAMCTSKWREGSPDVICGDACAWTEEAWSKGRRIAGVGAIGLVISMAVVWF